MFDNIFAAIEKWMRELLSGMVESNLSTMFTAVNQQTSEIAAQVGQTPQGWNSSIFSMIRNISDSVVIPIAGIIITLILCYELISMLTERNNLHDVDTWMFFKYFVKMGFAAGIGVPFYFLMRDTLGTSNAAAGMVLLMLPEFFFALYEKNGMHLETILTNFISVRFKRPSVRRYEVENLYDRELENAAPIQKKGGFLGKK